MDPGRENLSSLLKAWFAINKWTYNDVSSIIYFYNADNLLHGSQLCNLIAGKIEPKPKVFLGLGRLNEACTEPVPDGDLQEKLTDCRAVVSCTAQGYKLWTAGDFLNYFCNVQPELPALLIHKQNPV